MSHGSATSEVVYLPNVTYLFVPSCLHKLWWLELTQLNIQTRKINFSHSWKTERPVNQPMHYEWRPLLGVCVIYWVTYIVIKSWSSINEMFWNEVGIMIQTSEIYVFQIGFHMWHTSIIVHYDCFATLIQCLKSNMNSQRLLLSK